MRGCRRGTSYDADTYVDKSERTITAIGARAANTKSSCIGVLCEIEGSVFLRLT